MRRFLRRACSVATLLAAALALPVTDSAAVPAASSATHELSPLPLPKSARKWVETTLADLSLEEKAAQLVMVRRRGA